MQGDCGMKSNKVIIVADVCVAILAGMFAAFAFNNQETSYSERRH